MQSYGIQPGPQLLDNEPELVWALLASLFIANTLLLVLNLPLAPVWAKLLQIPRPYLYAGILFFASLGAYSVNFQAFDLGAAARLGLLGLAMRRFGLPVLPLIIGVILGPRLEEQLTRGARHLAGRRQHAVGRAGRHRRLRRHRAAAAGHGRRRAAQARAAPADDARADADDEEVDA